MADGRPPLRRHDADGTVMMAESETAPDLARRWDGVSLTHCPFPCNRNARCHSLYTWNMLLSHDVFTTHRPPPTSRMPPPPNDHHPPTYLSHAPTTHTYRDTTLPPLPPPRGLDGLDGLDGFRTPAPAATTRRARATMSTTRRNAHSLRGGAGMAAFTPGSGSGGAGMTAFTPGRVGGAAALLAGEGEWLLGTSPLPFPGSPLLDTPYGSAARHRQALPSGTLSAATVIPAAVGTGTAETLQDQLLLTQHELAREQVAAGTTQRAARAAASAATRECEGLRDALAEERAASQALRGQLGEEVARRRPLEQSRQALADEVSSLRAALQRRGSPQTSGTDLAELLEALAASSAWGQARTAFETAAQAVAAAAAEAKTGAVDGRAEAGADRPALDRPLRQLIHAQAMLETAVVAAARQGVRERQGAAAMEGAGGRDAAAARLQVQDVQAALAHAVVDADAARAEADTLRRTTAALEAEVAVLLTAAGEAETAQREAAAEQRAVARRVADLEASNAALQQQASRAAEGGAAAARERAEAEARLAAEAAEARLAAEAAEARAARLAAELQHSVVLAGEQAAQLQELEVLVAQTEAARRGLETTCEARMTAVEELRAANQAGDEALQEAVRCQE